MGHTGDVADERKTDNDTLSRIHDLVARERELREQLGHDEIDPSEEHARLRAIEIELDQCWDLLRQRRARRNAGEDPDGAGPRDENTVERYQPGVSGKSADTTISASGGR